MSNERDELADLIATGFFHDSYYGDQLRSGWNRSSLTALIFDAGYRKGAPQHRQITTEDELAEFPQGTKLYSPGTTHSWVLNDLSAHGGVKVHGTGGGYTYLRDFILHEAPLIVLHDPSEQ